MDPQWILTSIALATAVTGCLVWLGRIVWKLFRNTQDFLEDWAGTPARNGTPAKPGVLTRLGTLEDSMQHMVAETKPNGGDSLRDAVDQIADRVVEKLGKK